jgi:hypothetical protein
MAHRQRATPEVEAKILSLPSLPTRRPPRSRRWWTLPLLGGALLLLLVAALVWQTSRSQGPPSREVYFALAERPLRSLPAGFTCVSTHCTANNLKTVHIAGPGVVGEVTQMVIGPQRRRHVIVYRVFARGHTPAISAPTGTTRTNLSIVGLEGPLDCASVVNPQPETTCVGRVDNVALRVRSQGAGTSFDETTELADTAVRHLLGILEDRP